MKKYLFFATAIATASLFTGCSNNEYVGDQPEAFNGTDGAIAFSMGKANTTRAKIIDREAARKLNDVFYVYGKKYTGSPEVAKTVFDTYKVKYVESSANSTASNTKGWEYVGTLWANGGHEKSNVGGQVDNQTIKYWDYSARQYTFYAFSANPADVINSDDPNIKVSATGNPSTDPSYTVTIKEAASIGDLYFADKKEVEKNDYAGQGDTPADKAVQLTFRNLASKVRVGFYETVPGYSIKIKKMYGADTDESTSEFKAECPNTKAKQNSQITVTYKGGTKDDKYYAVVSGKKEEDGNTELSAVNTLTLGTGVFGSELRTTSSSPTWDTNNGEYTFFWPQTNDDNKPLKIKVDYTLKSTDGSQEEINVTGATATVPADYVKWAANTAYTYIFKISDNTNGSTGGEGGTEGLYPITFDAVVEDYANKGYITTVSTPSVTASQDGVTFVDPGSGIKFVTNKDIFLKVMTGNTEVTGVKIKSAYVSPYNYNKSPVQNLGGVAWEDVNYDGTNKYYKLNQKATDGWWILEVKESNEVSAATTYVIIRVGQAEEGPENPAIP